MDIFNKEFKKIMEERKITLDISAEEIKPLCRSLYEIAYHSEFINSEGDGKFSVMVDTEDKKFKKIFEGKFIEFEKEKNISDKKDKETLFELVTRLYVYTGTHLEKNKKIINYKVQNDKAFGITSYKLDLNNVSEEYLEEIKQDIIR